ncbi:MAG: sugar O-acetyltransferase [Bosea sp.]|uniref:sugar O-acetyltransferase n=1 Tax=Bosea sp. (in: a-proteobacteria) TaxID=1871050 RepID=UPI001ACEE6B7|nr:sugar O-acetyltransferase [Bosea sp. (in: a-proteobacteria)]MBN9470162.1 sugar O-acetyltransferase [Bosea sp. (in: a-proteobacteria)]
MNLDEQRALMRSGQMYDDHTQELIAARARAVGMTDAYNRSFGQPAAEREALLRTFLREVGDGALFEPNFRCEFGFNISIGRSFYANFDCVMLDGAEITIGDNVLLGPRVGIYTANHAIDPAERVAGGCYARRVSIGNRVWIGGGVQINQGVSIGNDSIIGAGSVVTRDIPAGVIAAGVPCKVLREITEADKTGFRPLRG